MTLEDEPMKMTLRDWFAGQALAGLLANPEFAAYHSSVVQSAFHHADNALRYVEPPTADNPVVDIRLSPERK